MYTRSYSTLVLLTDELAVLTFNDCANITVANAKKMQLLQKIYKLYTEILFITTILRESLYFAERIFSTVIFLTLLNALY